MDPLKISIVTPSYNQGEYIEETIKSVLDQDYENTELIIIDGGSNDSTMDVVKRYEKDISYFISEKDDGQTQAINKGFRQCTGDIVAWLNSDDIYLKDVLKNIAAVFSRDEECAMVYGDCIFVDEKGSQILRQKSLDFDIAMFDCGFVPIVGPTSFFRKSIIDEVGLLDESLKYVMDYDLWYRIGKEHKIVYLPEFLAGFRLHPESKTTSFSFVDERNMIRDRYRESLGLPRSLEEIYIETSRFKWRLKRFIKNYPNVITVRKLLEKWKI